MNIDKNYFISRLQAGESIDHIGNEIAAMMNQAVAEHEAKIRAAEEAKRAEAEKEQTKRGLVEELVKIIQELAILEGMDPEELKVTEEDMNQMIAAFNEMFTTMRELKKMVAHLESAVPCKAPKIAPSDDQILADFIKHFN